ncbi:hypothetical protein [Deinococcus sp.]|uniref:hypothetical protein n=1 Tax=Deinococcus sp. TaxID=47478 RepID=UPI003B58C8E0
MNTTTKRRFIFAVLLFGTALGTSAFATPPANLSASDARPHLPFPDNLDLTKCGIPTVLGDEFTGELSGSYGGELQEALVRLYDSHARAEVVGRAWTGSPARALLMVSGPQLSYLLVRVKVGDQEVEGWVPAPYFKRR